jgi:ATP-dependent exoDNAse (exonuclease V) beta subunit
VSRPPTANGAVADDRHLITEALSETLVVEAAAGTGKTTELVNRVVRLIATGAATIEQIVAVTFSEKAAGELKLRLREQLERHLVHTTSTPEAAATLSRAVQAFEEAHVSTIHGFCADLLRERPVEACIDPAFEVLTEAATSRLFDEAFADWIQEQLEAPAPGVKRALRRLRPRFGPDDEDEGPIDRIRHAGWELLQWRDHPTPWTRPDGFDRERDMEALLDALKTFAEISADPIDKRDVLFRETWRLRHAHAEINQLRSRGLPDFEGWEARLCELAAHERDLRKGRSTRGQYSRGAPRETVCVARDMLVDALVRFRDDADADLAALLHGELQSCIQRYEERKARAGALDFLDLLIYARNLVRDVPHVRHEFQRRFRFILVDEFQDTDPLQADLLWMLAAHEDPDAGANPLALPIRPGALFVVGDPKQSIYRFRRADVGVYHRVCERLLADGARRVVLQTSFRSVPAIQRAVNAAFARCMAYDADTLQADYVPLLPYRAQPDQPSVVALPVPRPYGKMDVTATAIGRCLPETVGEFVRWLVQESHWHIRDGNGRARRINPGDVCLLFRRFVDYRTDVTRAYVHALESRGVPHLLVGGKAFHEREEVDALRTALAAIERPDDALSVFATLRGPFFAIAEEDMLAWHALGLGFRPFALPATVPATLQHVADALRILQDLTRRRNHRPVAETIGQLLECTRAHAAFILWRGGEQVLANVLQIQELARQYEAEGGLSFRGFVDELQQASTRSQTPEAPILEEGTDGVRLMTVHKAKGLEFPVVILADIGCKLHRADAQRHLDTNAGLAAVTLAGWTPLDLIEHNALEVERDRAEAVRLAYVAATRARDLLVVPAVGDGEFTSGWVSPLSPAIYPQDAAPHAAAAERLPPFLGRDTVLERPDGQTATLRSVKPGVYELNDPCTRQPYTVVWWDPMHLDRPGEERRGIRREDLLTRDAPTDLVAAHRYDYERWRRERERVNARAAQPSVRVVTATEFVRSVDAAGGQPALSVEDVAIHDASMAGARPSGRRFGVLVHALLANIPLDAAPEDVESFAQVHARLLGASAEERAAASVIVQRTIDHEIWREARAAAASGRACWREAPISFVRDGVLIDGQLDLAYETAHGWIVVDFKTDAELRTTDDVYARQAALYAEALSAITGIAARGVILRV